jgi:hypothetical protein
MSGLSRLLALSTVAQVALLGASRAQAPRVLDSGHYITPAAKHALPEMCATGAGYPAQWTWESGDTWKHPVSATSGTPQIDQYRNGQLIASYANFSDNDGCVYKGDGTDWQNPGPPAASGCGPFTREHAWRLWSPGDIFIVHPAVYSGEFQQPWFGPEYDSPAQYNTGIPTPMKDITVIGDVTEIDGVAYRPVILLTGNASNNTYGQAPVYFDVSDRVTVSNINVVAGQNAWVGRAGVYEVGGSHLTLENMRISGFEQQSSGGDGLFGAGQYRGWLHLRQLELDHNGGTNGPQHNAYINASASDPDFTVELSHSWSHDAYYGHLFKSRAQRNVMIANYFQGGLPQPGYTQAETFLLDIPNGGIVVARNNVFAKNASGPSSNGISLTYAMEGLVDDRPQSIDIENNTFVGFTNLYDGAHPLFPMNFYYPSKVPGTHQWPRDVPVRTLKNSFVGYCKMPQAPWINYRGDIDVTEDFSELSEAFTFSTPVETDDAVLAQEYPDYVPVSGTPNYAHALKTGETRQTSMIGAED